MLLLLFGLLWQYCKANQYVLLLQRKHQNVWRLWRFCLLSLNPIFFYGMSLLQPRLSTSEMWAITLKDSTHWLKVVTVLVMPTISPPISQISLRHPWASSVSMLIEVRPAYVHNPVYILEWAFSFWGLVQVLRTSWGVWPWYFSVIEVLEGLQNIWRRRYGVPIFHLSVPVCTLGESWPWSCIPTGGEICTLAPDFNKFVKLMSEPIWHNFIILATCYLKVQYSLGVLNLQDSEQLWKKDFPQDLWCYLFCL